MARLPVVESDLNSLLQGREIKKTCVVLITGDRGLAGGFNANVIRLGAQEIAAARDTGSAVCAVTIGRKGRDWLNRYDPIVHAEFHGLPDAPARTDLTPITRLLIDDYQNGAFDPGADGLHGLCEHAGAESGVRATAARGAGHSFRAHGSGLHL